jgi:hypothetical protein
MDAETRGRLEGLTFPNRKGQKSRRCSPAQRRELYRLVRVDPGLAAGFEELLRGRSMSARGLFSATGSEAGAMIRFFENSRV